MKHKFKLLLLGLAVYLLFFITTIPANLLSTQLEKNLAISFTNTQGTVWQGKADNLFIEGIEIGAIEWDINTWRLLSGQINADVTIKGLHLSGQANLGISLNSKIFISNANFQADAEWVFLMAAIPVSATGTFHAHINQLTGYLGELPNVNAELHWQDAMINYPEIYELGEYTLVLSSQAENEEQAPEFILGTLSEKDSMLGTNGEIKLLSDGRYTLSADLIPRENTPDSLKSVLPMIGSPNNKGGVTFKQQGSIADLI